MGVTQYGVFCRKICCINDDGQRYIDVTPYANDEKAWWHFQPIVDHTKWNIARLKLLYPYEVHPQRGPGS